MSRDFDILDWLKRQRVLDDGRSRQTLLDIVTAGYHALSKKAHPDVGGTAERQQELNAGRAFLTSYIKGSAR